jgi:hypothetical protein
MTNPNNEESLLLTPEEVGRRRSRKEVEAEQQIKHSLPSSNEKFYNRGGRVAINYESLGRFSIPATLYFKDYTIEDVNDLTLSRQEDILETVISILNKCKNEDAQCDVADMTVEEFLETLIGMKSQFNTSIHIHRWLDKCQTSVDEEERTFSESEIDLNTLKYSSIEEADQKIQAYFKDLFSLMSPEEWKNYLYSKYQDNPLENIDTYTKEEEIKTIRLTEPIIYPFNGKKYAFRLTRIGDVVKGQKIAQKQFAAKIKAIQNKRDPNIPLNELKVRKERELEDVKIEQTRKATLYSRALSLISIDGKSIPENERISHYKDLPRQGLIDFINLLDNAVFGVNDERELTCNLCNEAERRLLRQEINPVELLPLDTNTTRKLRKSAGVTLYFGV